MTQDIEQGFGQRQTLIALSGRLPCRWIEYLAFASVGVVLTWVWAMVPARSHAIPTRRTASIVVNTETDLQPVSSSESNPETNTAPWQQYRDRVAQQQPTISLD